MHSRHAFGAQRYGGGTRLGLHECSRRLTLCRSAPPRSILGDGRRRHGRARGVHHLDRPTLAMLYSNVQVSRKVTRGARAVLSALRTSWLICGIALLLLIGLNSLGSVYLAQASSDPWAEGFGPQRARTENDAPWFRVNIEFTDQVVAPTLGHKDFRLYGHTTPVSGATAGVTIGPDLLRYTVNRRPQAPRLSRDVTIHCFGGSTMWGFGNRDEHTIPSNLARLLAGEGYNVVVKNYAVWGYAMTHELIHLLLNLQVDIKSDIAIFFDGFNEMLGPIHNGNLGNGFGYHQRVANAEPMSTRRAFEFLTRETSLYAALHKNDPPPPEPLWPRDNLQPAVTDIVKRYRVNMTALRAIAATYGIEPIFFWQPLVYSKKVLSAAEEEVARGYNTDVIEYKELFRLVSSEAAIAPGVIDISHIFDDTKESMYNDNVHYTEVANERVAEAMLPHVVQAIGRLSGVIDSPPPGQR
jgi:hypothetical protein